MRRIGLDKLWRPNWDENKSATTDDQLGPKESKVSLAVDKIIESFTTNVGVSQDTTQPMLYVDLTTKQGEIAEEQVEDETEPQKTNDYPPSTLPKVKSDQPIAIPWIFR